MTNRKPRAKYGDWLHAPSRRTSVGSRSSCAFTTIAQVDGFILRRWGAGSGSVSDSPGRHAASQSPGMVAASGKRWWVDRLSGRYPFLDGKQSARSAHVDERLDFIERLGLP